MQLAGGITLITASATHEREVEVSAFGSAVGNWSATFRPHLQGSSMVVFASGGGSAELQHDTATADSSIKDKGTDVAPFEPLFFGGKPLRGLLPNVSFAKRPVSEPGDRSGMGVDPNTAHLFLNITDGMTGQRSMIGPMVVDTTMLKRAYSQTPAPEVKCRSRGGYPFSGNMCALFMRIKSVCVQVRRDMTGQWGLAHHSSLGSVQADASQDSLASAGCRWAGSDAGGWAARAYKYVRADRLHGRPSGVQDLSDFEFAVREEHDPYIFQKAVTHGTGEFPLSSHDSIVLGAFMLFAAALLGIQPAYECRAMYRGFAPDVAYGGLREVEGRAQWPDVAQDAAVSGVPAQEGTWVDLPPDQDQPPFSRGEDDLEMVAVDIDPAPHVSRVRQRSISPTQARHAGTV